MIYIINTLLIRVINGVLLILFTLFESHLRLLLIYRYRRFIKALYYYIIDLFNVGFIKLFLFVIIY